MPQLPSVSELMVGARHSHSSKSPESPSSPGSKSSHQSPPAIPRISSSVSLPGVMNPSLQVRKSSIHDPLSKPIPLRRLTEPSIGPIQPGQPIQQHPQPQQHQPNLQPHQDYFSYSQQRNLSISSSIDPLSRIPLSNQVATHPKTPEHQYQVPPPQSNQINHPISHPINHPINPQVAHIQHQHHQQSQPPYPVYYYPYQEAYVHPQVPMTGPPQHAGVIGGYLPPVVVHNQPGSGGMYGYPGGITYEANNALRNKRRIIKRRTRTGCLTCRKRRIKCDERKPHCYNCERSKKLCLGYENLGEKYQKKLDEKDESSEENRKLSVYDIISD